jgi:hypothetical protein
MRRPGAVSRSWHAGLGVTPGSAGGSPAVRATDAFKLPFLDGVGIGIDIGIDFHAVFLGTARPDTDSDSDPDSGRGATCVDVGLAFQFAAPASGGRAARAPRGALLLQWKAGYGVSGSAPNNPGP